MERGVKPHSEWHGTGKDEEIGLAVLSNTADAYEVQCKIY